MSQSTITVERIGRRSYLRGNTYPIKDRIQAAGGHWDADQKAWWLGDAAKAEALLTTAAQAPELQAYTPTDGEQMVAVEGNTYAARDRLRALGGQWDGSAKVWRVPASQIAAARAAVASTPRQEYRPTSCKACGARPQRNARGYSANGVYLGRDGLCSDCRDEARMGY